jgi:Ca2+-binding RTX toxin-like protein
MTVFVGTKKDDDFTGTDDGDTFELSQGGHDKASGGDGSDTFIMGAAFDANDQIDGGAWSDTVSLEGDYDLTMNATTMVNVEFLQLIGNHNYRIVMNDANVADYEQLNVSMGSDAAHSLVFDGSAETLGRFQIYSGAGSDVLTGGASGDFMSAGEGDNTLNGNAGGDTLMAGSGHNVLNGGADADTIYSYGHDAIDGGTGDDFLYLKLSGSTQDLSLNIVDTATPATLIGQGTTIVGVERFWVEIGSGNDHITLGDGNDRIIDSGGNNVLHGGGGNDIIQSSQYAQSTHNELYGDAGNDSLYGGNPSGTVVLDGGNGDDQLFSYGPGKIVGGKGMDIAYIDLHNSSANLTFHASVSGTSKFIGADLKVSGVEAFNISTGGGNDDITTLDGNDTIDAGSGNNIVHAGGGSDVIRSFTGFGNNLFDGGDGNDTISDGSIGGNDTLLGGNGDDQIASYAGTDTIDGGDGNDTLTIYSSVFSSSTPLKIVYAGVSAWTTVQGTGTTFTGIENLDLYGGSGNDVFIAGDGRDYLVGGEGNNTLVGGGGDDILTVQSTSGTNTLKGGDGNDTLIGANHVGTLSGGDGNDTINSFAADDIDGGDGNDSLLANRGGHVNGGAGDDRIDMGMPGTVDGGKGVDNVSLYRSGATVDLIFKMTSLSGITTLQGDGTTVTGVESLSLFGGSGNDQFSTLGGNDTLYGGAGNNTLNGGGGDDVISEAYASGNNTLNGEDGNDTLYVGLGQDFVNGGAGRDTIFARDGAATIDGGTGQDFAYLGALDSSDPTALTFEFAGLSAVTTLVGQGTTVIHVEAFQLEGGSGADHFTTGDGDDILMGNGGDDVLNGGKGIDTVVFNAYTSVDANLTTGVATGEGTDTLIAIENLVGTATSDVLTGDAKNNRLDGGTGGMDVLNGGDGDDTLVSTPHNTRFPQFYEGSALDGGLGNDTAIIDRSGAFNSLTFDFAGATAVTTLVGDGINAGSGDTTVTGVENIQLTGGWGNDTFTAGDGDDVLNGGGGNDTLNGAGGNNVLIGGVGIDQLIGGPGNNTYLFAAAYESTAPFSYPIGFSASYDTIVKFDASHDHVDLPTAVVAVDAPITSGALSKATFATDIVNAMSSLAANHAVLFTADSGNLAHQTFLVVDMNGVAGFQAGGDLLVRLDHPAQLDGLSTANFI